MNNPKSDEITKMMNEVSGTQKHRFMELYEDATSD